ncbi:MAG: hypothetical protein ACT4P1_07680 [Sporichthyaceae bacterium]
MDLQRLRLAVVVAIPGLILAAVGGTHPHLLTVESARDWWTLHVPLLLVFPLLAGALALLLRGDNGVLAWAARIAGFGFAVGYTALDAIDGIAAGLVVETAGAPQDAITGRLFEIGDRIGRAGIWSLVAAALLTAAALWRTRGPWVIAGVIPFLYGTTLFYDHHIFAPDGVIGMLLIAAGTAMLALAPCRRPAAAVAEG